MLEKGSNSMSPANVDTKHWVGRTVTDHQHHRLGVVDAIYLDDDNHPLWMAVRTRRFGARSCFVPVDEAVCRDEVIVTPYDRRKIEAAPKLDTVEELPDEQVQALYSHYGLDYDAPIESAWRMTMVVERVLMYLP
jgi:hypothetical protein